MTLMQIINLIVGALHHAGAHHPTFGAVSPRWGWVITHHWIIRICHVGAKGCGL